jgi:hypothetical protein
MCRGLCQFATADWWHADSGIAALVALRAGSFSASNLSSLQSFESPPHIPARGAKSARSYGNECNDCTAVSRLTEIDAAPVRRELRSAEYFFAKERVEASLRSTMRHLRKPKAVAGLVESRARKPYGPGHLALELRKRQPDVIR